MDPKLTSSIAYYLREFKKIDEGKLSWNWCSALAGPLWCLYRKMYGAFFGYILVIGFINSIHLPMIANGCLQTLLLFFLGFIGNGSYYSVVKIRIKSGYHLSGRYKPVSNLSLTMVALFILSEILVSYFISPVLLLLLMLFSAVIVLTMMFEKIVDENILIENTKKGSTEVNEENIVSLLSDMYKNNFIIPCAMKEFKNYWKRIIVRNREKRTEYYLREFRKINGKRSSWNWSACLFTTSWCLYRKMYFEAVLVTLVLLPLEVITFYEMGEYGLVHRAKFVEFSLAYILCKVIAGLLGNKVYYYSLKQKIKEGYHLCNSYKPTSIFLSLFPALFLLFYMMYFEIIYDNPLLLCIFVLELVPFICWYYDRRIVNKAVMPLCNFSAEVSETNISKIIS